MCKDGAVKALDWPDWIGRETLTARALGAGALTGTVLSGTTLSRAVMTFKWDLDFYCCITAASNAIRLADNFTVLRTLDDKLRLQFAYSALLKECIVDLRLHFSLFLSLRFQNYVTYDSATSLVLECYCGRCSRSCLFFHAHTPIATVIPVLLFLVANVSLLSQDTPTFSSDVKVVNVLATVRDKKGNIINNLTQGRLQTGRRTASRRPFATSRARPISRLRSACWSTPA